MQRLNESFLLELSRMKLEHCKVIASAHVLNIFIGNKKSSFNIEDLNKINAIETTEGSHTGKILGAMLGTGAQVAMGDFFGVLQVIGTGAGDSWDPYDVFCRKKKGNFTHPDLYREFRECKAGAK